MIVGATHKISVILKFSKGADGNLNSMILLLSAKVLGPVSKDIKIHLKCFHILSGFCDLLGDNI